MEPRTAKERETSKMHSFSRTRLISWSISVFPTFVSTIHLPSSLVLRSLKISPSFRSIIYLASPTILRFLVSMRMNIFFHIIDCPINCCPLPNFIKIKEKKKKNVISLLNNDEQWAHPRWIANIIYLSGEESWNEGMGVNETSRCGQAFRNNEK